MKKIIMTILVIAVVAVAGGFAWGVNYLFNYAIAAGPKDFFGEDDATGSQGKDIDKWEFAKEPAKVMTQKTDDGLELSGRLFQQEQEGRKKIAIIAHGYTSSSDFMYDFGKMFYQDGYDIFLADARGHGRSEGKYIGFGWPDRLDYVKWIDQINKEYDNKVDIVLYGISMGASTVLMTSGESLPDNVKAIVADCGYDTVENELSYQLDQMFGLPAFPLIPVTSKYTEMRAGYNFKEASAVKQLEKNQLPILFIHGDKDDFVPTDMVYPLYDAAKGPKELYLVPGAKHAEAFKTDPKKYEEVVNTFLTKYLSE
ncbi:alpha/beta hydrolase [Vagococcus coleopterorum]|uniref:Alpha/beta hydrolase n=1 Tax=Vagococcus coleopterorum TaxID=2714946 RepID=A0A6G8AMW5_9ENTE|nr:alpha/beta hydrolase [Vagococcus coleopterorum]QIL46424.1 alpha/beta hydrolase [Vagococcus coleopterorum]